MSVFSQADPASNEALFEQLAAAVQIPYERFELANGLTVLVHTDRTPDTPKPGAHVTLPLVRVAGGGEARAGRAQSRTSTAGWPCRGQ